MLIKSMHFIYIMKGLVDFLKVMQIYIKELLKILELQHASTFGNFLEMFHAATQGDFGKAG